MNGTDPNERFVYCKNGDVSTELENIGLKPTEIPAGGPAHYVSTVLQWINGKPALLLSYYNRNNTVRIGNVVAKVFQRRRSSNGKLLFVATEISLFLKTLSHLLTFRPTKILCAASGSPLWACFIVSRLYSVPLVCTRHGSVVPSHRHVIRKYINKWVVRHASAVMCHGPFLENELQQIGIPIQRLFTFNNAYRYLLSYPTDHKNVPDIAEHGKNIVTLFIGRIRKDKGIFDLLEALSPILEANSNLRLIYVGDGPDFSSLQHVVAKSSVRDQIILLGHMDHELLPTLVHQCKVMISPTHPGSTEARPKTVIEALVGGKPVIAPNFGPFPYLIKDGVNGLLYQPESVPDLRNKIATILNDDELYTRLTLGAKQAEEDLLDSSRTFQQALQLAFKASKS